MQRRMSNSRRAGSRQQTGVVPAPLGSRFMASFLDSLILGVPFVVLLVLRGGLAQGNLYGHGVVRVLAGLGVTAATGVYQVAFLVLRGQTPGKMATAVRVVDVSTGQLPTVGQALRRYAAMYLAAAIVSLLLPGGSSLLGIVVGISVLADAKHRGLHDKAAATIVVVA